MAIRHANPSELLKIDGISVCNLMNLKLILPLSSKIQKLFILSKLYQTNKAKQLDSKKTDNIECAEQ